MNRATSTKKSRTLSWIMETLGHSQISLTLNTYAHVMPALQRAAAAKMDAILSR